MATEPKDSIDTPQYLLANAQELMIQTRQNQRATWFPLFVLAAITFLAIPVLRISGQTLTNCGIPEGGGYACHVHSTWGIWYWPLALVLAYIGISIFYIQRSLVLGLESHIRTFGLTGIGIAIIATAMGYWAVHLPVGEVNLLGMHFQERSLGLLHRIATPACAIGVALLVLARIERNRDLVFVDVFYLAFVLLPINLGWNLSQSRGWNFLPRLVLDGTILLMAGIGFAVTQRRNSRPSV